MTQIINEDFKKNGEVSQKAEKMETKSGSSRKGAEESREEECFRTSWCRFG